MAPLLPGPALYVFCSVGAQERQGLVWILGSGPRMTKERGQDVPCSLIVRWPAKPALGGATGATRSVERGADAVTSAPRTLSLRRVGIVAVGVALADATVFSVDQHFRLLVLCDSTGNADGFALGCDDFGSPLGASTLDGPARRPKPPRERLPPPSLITHPPSSAPR